MFCIEHSNSLSYVLGHVLENDASTKFNSLCYELADCIINERLYPCLFSIIEKLINSGRALEYLESSSTKSFNSAHFTQVTSSWRINRRI